MTIEKAITPGGRIGDDSPLGTPGGRQNWVDRAGGLPKYIRMVAHAMQRKGKSESRAIQMAVGIVKNWAAGKGNVTPKVRAAAIAAIAEWEAKKAGGSVAKVAMQEEINKILVDAVFENITKQLLCEHNISVMKSGCPMCMHQRHDMEEKKAKKRKIKKDFDPNQPRDPHTGQWVDSPMGLAREAALLANNSRAARIVMADQKKLTAAKEKLSRALESGDKKKISAARKHVREMERNWRGSSQHAVASYKPPPKRKHRVKKRFVSQDERKSSSTPTYPGTTKFPVANQSDFNNAWKLRGNSSIPKEKVESWLRGLAKRKGYSIPGDSIAKISDADFENLVQEIDADVEQADEFYAEGKIEKSDSEKQLVFGWCSIAKTKDGKEVVDKQGDVLEDIDQMEKVAYDFVLHSRDGGEMHVRKGVSTLVESFMSTPEKWEAMGIPEGTLPTGWWVGFKVNDPRVWEDVKKKKYRMFSVHGSGLRKALEE